MESKRGEACKYKEIAEEKFRGRDLKGGYRYAQKAKELFPKLEGISAMLIAVQVLLAAEAKLQSKLVDWYAVLQVNEFSHLALISKQYRKFYKVLRPHKNKYPVAEEAFKLIGEAWRVLSHKSRKYEYDSMRRCLINQQQEASKPAPSDPNASFSSEQMSSVDTQIDSLKAQNVDCPSGLLSPADTPMDFLKNSSHAQSSMHTHMTSRRNPNVASSTGGDRITAANMASSTGGDSITAANMASGKSKSMNSNFWTACSSCYTVQEYPRCLKRHEIRCPDCTSPFLAVEVGTMSVNDFNKRTSKGSNEEKDSAMTEKEKIFHEDNKAQDVRRKRAVDEPKEAKSRTKEAKNESRKQKNSVPTVPSASVDPVLMVVQDSDFYDFDQDRVENCFEENQIWAIYDNHEGMPRYYAVINKIVSLHPFNVQITWLDGKDDGDECLTRWATAGFCRTCGKFREGMKADIDVLNVFSHLMKGEKVLAGLLKIFPRKDSVWALYRNWQPDWDESTPKDVIRKYDIVMILTDFTETFGVGVVRLVKLDGFKSVYHRNQTGPKAVEWVSQKGFLRFSHQIPARRLSGNESKTSLKGLWELDPAATPMD